MTVDTEHIPGHLPVQEKRHVHCEKNEQGGQSSPMPIRSDEDEGLRLDQVLAAHGLNRSKLAKKTGISPSTCQKWRDALGRGDITDSMWHSCATALSRVGIDPGEVRPGAKAPTKTRVAELVGPIMAISDRAVLSLLLEVLTVESQDDRDAIAALVSSKISRL